MKKLIFACAAILVVSAPAALATDLDTYCEDWKDACREPSFQCPTNSETGHGLEFEVYQAIPGCEFSESDVTITNTNADIAVGVYRYGSQSGKNIYFQNDCPDSVTPPQISLCDTGECCEDCTPEGATCPGPGDTWDGCEVNLDEEVCACEVEDKVVYLNENDSDTGGCLLPDVDPSTLDDCDWCELPSEQSFPSDFCLYLTPPKDSNGVQFQITEVSFDNGACWYDLPTRIAIPQSDIDVSTNAFCPATTGASAPRNCD